MWSLDAAGGQRISVHACPSRYAQARIADPIGINIFACPIMVVISSTTHISLVFSIIIGVVAVIRQAIPINNILEGVGNGDTQPVKDHLIVEDTVQIA